MKIEDDDLIVDEEVNEDIEEEVIEKSETSEEDPESIQDDDEDEEDRIVTIGDSDEPEDGEADEDSTEEKQPDPVALVKKLRGVTRGLEKKNKALKKQLEEKSRPTETIKPVELGAKPTLASCKYDDKAYEESLISYYERKRKVDEQAANRAKQIEEQNKAWQTKQQAYAARKEEHNFRDYEDAEDLVKDTFSELQQSIIVAGADDPALLVYALGKNPKKLEELAKITDTIAFTFKVAKLESQLKVTNKKAPKPEKRVSTGKSGGSSATSDKVLERLREKADKTGDFSEVIAYRKKLRNKG